MLDNVVRPFQAGRGIGSFATGRGGDCINVNECLFNVCDPHAICIDASAVTAADIAGTQFGTYGGFICACGPDTLKWRLADPSGKAYGLNARRRFIEGCADG